jgi:hypothetical protein
MSARVIADASITVVLPGRVVDADGIAAADELATRLRGAPVLVAPDLPGALARERLLLSP